LVSTTYIFLFFLSLSVTLVGLFFSKYILLLIKTPEDIIQQAKIYLDITFIGIFFLFGYNGVSALLRGMGDSKTPLYLLIIATILNIILDLLFVLVFKWGIAGAAWATIISQGVSFISGLIYLKIKDSVLKLNLKELHFNSEFLFRSLKIGIPSGIQQISVAIGMMAITRIVNTFGTETLAGFTAAQRIDGFAAMPAMNFSIALSTFTGQNIGANRLDRIKSGVKATFLISTIFSLIITIIIITFSKELIQLFNRDPEVIRIGKEYLVIVSSFYIAFALMFVFNAVARGAGATFIPMLITISSLWFLRVPISYTLSKYIGTKGIWWGIPIAWIFGAIASFIYYKSDNWKKHINLKIIQKEDIIIESGG